MLVPLLLLIAQVGDPRRSYAAGDKDAVLMLPPLSVCDSDVKEMVWTADGSALVVRRLVGPPTLAELPAYAAARGLSLADLARLPPETELLVWSASSHKARKIASSTLAVSDMRPMPGTDRVVFSAEKRTVDADGARHEVLTVAMLSASSGTVTLIASTDESRPMVSFDLSPSHPLGFVLTAIAATKAQTVRFFGPDGHPGNPITMPPKGHIAFDPAGRPVLVLGHDRQGKTLTFHYQKVNVAAGTLGERYDAGIDGEFDPSPPKAALAAVPVDGAADGSRAPSILLEVAGGKAGESGVVTTDGVDALVSPKGDAVAYVSQGGAMVRPLTKVPRAVYDKALADAARTEALLKAKQVGTAMIMFASDMDDVLPGQDVDLRTKLGPYLKNDGLLDGFTYTFHGGTMTDIDAPASTEMGYVSGPGGRAVVYVDGHAKWIPDAP